MTSFHHHLRRPNPHIMVCSSEGERFPNQFIRHRWLSFRSRETTVHGSWVSVVAASLDHLPDMECPLNETTISSPGLFIVCYRILGLARPTCRFAPVIPCESETTADAISRESICQAYLNRSSIVRSAVQRTVRRNDSLHRCRM